MEILPQDGLTDITLLYNSQTTIIWLLKGIGPQEYFEFTFYTNWNLNGFREMMQFVRDMHKYEQDNRFELSENEAKRNFMNQKSSEVVDDREGEYILTNTVIVVDRPDFYVDIHDENERQCISVVIPIDNLAQSLITLTEAYHLLTPLIACAGG